LPSSRVCLNRRDVNAWHMVVDRLADKAQRHAAALALCDGDLSARANRGRPLAADKIEALIQGLLHPDPAVRRSCLEILDQHPAPQAVASIVDCLDDSVPRVRWHAVHALVCDACKPGTRYADAGLLRRIAEIAERDPNPRVRRQAQWGLDQLGVSA
jgi:HEAT repeat protein